MIGVTLKIAKIFKNYLSFLIGKLKKFTEQTYIINTYHIDDLIYGNVITTDINETIDTLKHNLSLLN